MKLTESHKKLSPFEIMAENHVSVYIYLKSSIAMFISMLISSIFSLVQLHLLSVNLNTVDSRYLEVEGTL